MKGCWPRSFAWVDGWMYVSVVNALWRPSREIGVAKAARCNLVLASNRSLKAVGPVNRLGSCYDPDEFIYLARCAVRGERVCDCRSRRPFFIQSKRSSYRKVDERENSTTAVRLRSHRRPVIFWRLVGDTRFSGYRKVFLVVRSVYLHERPDR